MTPPIVDRHAATRATATRWFDAAPWQPTVVADAAVIAMLALLLPGPLTIELGITLAAILGATGCYRPRFTSQVGAVIGRLVAGVTITTVAVAAVNGPTRALLVIRVAPFALVMLVGARCVASVGVRRMRVHLMGQPALIVGAGALGATMAANLLAHPELGLRPIGVVDDVADERLPLPLLGGTGELARIVEQSEVRHVIVAYGRADEPRMVEVLRTCEHLEASVWVVPRLFELSTSAGETDELWGIPVAKLNRRTTLRAGQWQIKRAFDVLVSTAALLIASPLMVAIAILVRISSPGPVFFRQLRVGQRGRPVEIFKFRTMRVNDDSDKTWSVIGDNRVTGIGRFLRATSLDEIPQLLNVVRGDMSLVGPRPERPHFVELFSDTVRGYQHRHRVPVGLTGLAQVNGLRGDTSIEERARFDNLYIENWSLWVDFVIICRTVFAVVRHGRKDVFEPVASDASALPSLAEMGEKANLSELPSPRSAARARSKVHQR